MISYPDLFAWWATTISWSIVFLTVVSVYLYRSRKVKEKGKGRETGRPARLVGDFVFVWILFGLLVLYIVSINQGSAVLFAAGNIAVEIALVVYTLKNRTDGQ